MKKPTLKHYFKSSKTGEMVRIEGSPIAIRAHERNNKRLLRLGFSRVPAREYESKVNPIGDVVREMGVGMSYQGRKDRRMGKPKHIHLSRYVLNQIG